MPLRRWRRELDALTPSPPTPDLLFARRNTTGGSVVSADEPSPEELLKQIKVDDVLLQTVVTLINLGGRRLTVKEEKDPAQAKQAIDAARALLPLCPEEEIGPIKDALSQLQMVYVRETDERAKARSKIWTPPGSS
jgi:hypothetical protein